MSMKAPREQFVAAELAIVLSHYDLGIVTDIVEFPKGSHAAAKVVVTTTKGRFLLKRRPRGKEDPYRVAFAHALQNFLAHKHFPLPHLIGTRENNNSMLKIEDSIYEVFEFIEGVHYDGGLVPTYEAGKTLGLYHKLIQDYHPEYDPPPGHYHDAKGVHEAFDRMAPILEKLPSATGREREVAHVVATVRKAYASAARAVNELGLAGWQTQIVHSDWHPGNMIFDRGHVAAVIDYDAARVAARVVDIANGCLQFSMVTGGRDVTAWEDRTDTARSRRFLRGYDEMNVVSQAELAAVPFLMQEALIAQTVPRIMKSGTFAGLDGFLFLQTVIRKIEWLQANRAELELENRES
ncbi:MAG TPA: phosphotransferase [Phycisphaerae bacterium]|nr:phosphotransferase [Phycisphaerae bacterium]